MSHHIIQQLTPWGRNVDKYSIGVRCINLHGFNSQMYSGPCFSFTYCLHFHAKIWVWEVLIILLFLPMWNQISPLCSWAQLAIILSFQKLTSTWEVSTVMYSGVGWESCINYSNGFSLTCTVLFPQVALLCGPPGLGKTTLAHVIARHAGYNVVEMNARCLVLPLNIL